MQRLLKIVAATAIITTFAWAAVITLAFWLTARVDDRIKTQFIMEKGSFGIIDSTNTKTQRVVVVIEELPLDTNAPGRVELARRELAPRQRLRIGYREIMEKTN